MMKNPSAARVKRPLPRLSVSGFLCNFLLTNAQKYKPLTYIFDIGGSFQSLTEIFGGSYLNVGQESRDFRINPFSLEPTKENLQFLFSFFRVNVDSVSYWIATNNARDNQLKREYFARFGVAEGVRRLAEEHPFSLDQRAAKKAAAPSSTNAGTATGSNAVRSKRPAHATAPAALWANRADRPAALRSHPERFVRRSGWL